MANGGFFPKREVVRVSLAIAAEGGGFDAVGVFGLPLGVDKIVVSGPAGVRLRGGERTEDDGGALLLGESEENRLGIGREKQIGNEDPECVGAEREAVDLRRDRGIGRCERFDVCDPSACPERERIDSDSRVT